MSLKTKSGMWAFIFLLHRLSTWLQSQGHDIMGLDQLSHPSCTSEGGQAEGQDEMSLSGISSL